MPATEPALPRIRRQRRERVAQWLRAAGGGVAIVPTAPQVARNRDNDYPYRHDSYFYYLTGFAEPEAVLAIVAPADSSPARSLLFCRPKHKEREIWDGLRAGPEAAREAFGLDEARSIETLDASLPDLLANAHAVAYPLADNDAFDQHMRRWLDAVRTLSRAGVSAPRQALDVRVLLDEMRLFKDASEIDIMRRAARISAGAHVRAMQTARGGLREYHLEAELLYAFRRHGAQGVAYDSIVAAGPNACVLHHRASNAELRNGDLCLIDAGCELDGYASDITRTFPINGRFSGPQRALYEIVLAAQEAAIRETRPGAPYNAAHDAATRVLAQGMLDTGLLDAHAVGTLDDVLANNHYQQFYMHRTGHWLGMDVHDVGEYRAAPHPSAAGPRPWRALEAGMALTIEPGLYVRPMPGVPEHYWHIGIRIEDDALITADGCELITRDAPVAVADIEALMRSRA